MNTTTDLDGPARKKITQQSSTKVLEILLHTLNENISTPLDALIGSGENLDQNQREKLGELKDAIDRMELIMSNSLQTSAVSSLDDARLLNSGVSQNIIVEKVLRSLASNTSAHDSEEFFRYCVKTLADLYNCKFAFIGLIKENRTQVRTLCVWAGDKHVENFEYDLEGTPCKDIINFNKELIPKDASILYPNDELLVQMGVESYFGSPLITKDLGVIGIVSVMDTKPMWPDEWASPILGVFASRVALEVLRKHAVEKLITLNQELEDRVKLRTQDLEASNEELKTFSYSVSHDLRAPVRSINSFMNIVFEDFGDQIPKEALDYLGRVKRSGETLTELIDSMLDLARVTQQDMLNSKIDVSQLVESCVEEVRHHYPGREIKIDIESGMANWGDEALLKLALNNLISNAWKYTVKESNPVVEVGQFEQDDKIVYFVRDNGSGFDMKMAQKLFKPFQRLHSQSEFEGVGVGLATTRRVITRHGGEIWAQASRGGGATFYFTLGDSKPIRM